MKIYSNRNDYSTQNRNINKEPAFKAGASSMLNLSGNLMQGIENSGFLGSFLIQDFCGMTIPRTTAGFLRDKEYTGQLNMQEGMEVFGREGLTGPCMMAVAPLSLLAASKFGRSNSSNTALIKRFGNSLTEIISKPDFDKNLLNNKEQFKQEFYKINIKNILENTVGKENTTQESIDYIIKQINNYENIPKDAVLKKFRGKAKYRNSCMNNIMEHIDNITYSKSNNLDMLQKVKFGSDKLDKKKIFGTENVFDAMIKYSDDAISLNKNLANLNQQLSERIKNTALGKRMITNVAIMATTLGVLSTLPKIYARSNVAPGARKIEESKNKENISFKGANKGFNIAEKLGKYINKNKSDFVAQELEYNGHNFTNTLMAGLSVFGLLTPRGLRAYNRAQTDEKTGKKDLTELWEILIRDLTSSLAVVFAVPMLTRACVTSYEKHSGFVLMHKNRNNVSKLKTTLDLLNPYSKSHVLTNSEINSLYNNITSKSKMINFCEYISKNGGDLQKILSKSKAARTLLKDNKLDLLAIKKLAKNEKNLKIIDAIKNMNQVNADELIKKAMKAIGKSKNNKISAFARGLTSVPAALTTFFISPYLLGWFIPRLTYANTRRIHAKQDAEKEALEKQKSITNN